MKIHRSAAIALVFAASTASGQQARHTQPTVPPRVAAIAPAPAPRPVQSGRRAYYGHGAFRYDVPILLMGDGRVFADFGRGWEAVSRSCGLPPGSASSQIVSPSGLQQPVVVQPTVTQPAAPGIERLPYTPPVPAQETPSQRMAEQGGRLIPAPVGNQSCWAMSNGRVVVTQP
jgi:hypothetical protein